MSKDVLEGGERLFSATDERLKRTVISDQDEIAVAFEGTHAVYAISAHRKSTSYDVAFNIEETAASIGGTIIRSDEGNEQASLSIINGIWSFRLPTDAIVVPESPADLFLFGHEMGHWFLFDQAARHSQEVLNRMMWATKLSIFNGEITDTRRHQNRRVEAFCDYFASKMLEVDI